MQALADKITQHVDGSWLGCWVWQRSTMTQGYGQVWWKDRLVSTHRSLYQACYGPIPAGLQIDHLCRTRRCCNPLHMEAVTPRENTRRGNAPSVALGKRTHCNRGHPYAGENLRIERSGGSYRRTCRECERQRDRARRS